MDPRNDIEVIELRGIYPKKEGTNTSIGQSVLADLRMRIIAKHFESGTVISENKLSEEYNVSRSPVREALRVLEQERLIKLQRMGAKVLGITEEDIDEIYDVRLMIESFVFNILLEQENNEDLLRELNKIFEMMKIAIKYKDADEFSFKDIEFHDVIIHAIDHGYISILWTNIKPVVECLVLIDMRHRMEENYDDFDRVIENHELLIRAIEQKDKKLVEEAFYRNFRDVTNNAGGIWAKKKNIESE